ncbi:PH domain-containing protein [Halobacillus sp. Nhm2S1]|uniref:PH domain-containing protein n=1 Tax=Halobacillus sp. Nhm2S1 TaxID=2866716 RepID=UPI001C73D25B|nr:PH domain-containing protein [Halobacillus sp. Nhm2S1]MBX0356943.1 PH domain-containing protein [Halobacillus sp. Nhm2S1]
MYFPSKRNIFYSITVWGLILFIFFIYLFGGEPIGFQIITYRDPLGYVMSGGMIVLLLWILFRTGYTVKDGHMYIHSGPLRKRIAIEDIKKIKSTKSLISSPALSIRKLEILYGEFMFTSISPKDEHKFLQVMKKENPHIKIDPMLTQENN